MGKFTQIKRMIEFGYQNDGAESDDNEREEYNPNPSRGYSSRDSDDYDALGKGVGLFALWNMFD